MITRFDPLWVPLITHYCEDGSLDETRCRAHINHICDEVWQYLIAGTTGDGWEMSDAVLDQWLELCSTELRPHQSFLVGAFAAETEAVIARAERIEAHFRRHPSRATCAGLTLCAPVNADATQDEIAEHFSAIFRATKLPIAIYQLPQITGCTISPTTFASLSTTRRVSLFKDTSGADEIAGSGAGNTATFLVRGAEGNYAQHLKPQGLYDGWLLSSANYLAAELRHIVRKLGDNQFDAAGERSRTVDTIVSAVFSAAEIPGRNAFADASRAGDHIRAYGSAWASLPPPRRADGSQLAPGILDSVDRILKASLRSPASGYHAAAL